jgi:CelD/BcsL family acetyltransferase involved in cellulose biosynthesis
VQVATAASTARVAPAQPRLSIDTIADAAAFFALEGEWNDLVERAGVAHPFLRHEWLRTWWECFGGGCELRVLVVRAGDRMVAAAPLFAETARMYGMPIRRLRLMHNDHTPRADVIVAERAAAVYDAIWSTLMASRDSWDVLQLGQLPDESSTAAWIPRLALSEGCTSGVWHSSDSPYLTLTGTWEQYFNSLSAKFRQNVRNRVSRLRRIGEPKLEVVRGGAELGDAIADVVRLEESGWKRQAGTAIESDPSVHAFYRRFAERAADRGWLRLLFLNVGGRRIAASYSLCYARRVFLCKTGFDREFETCSPFKVLTSLAVRSAYEEGLVEVDFLGDTEPWKREWTPAVRSHQWLFVFSNAGRARVIYPLKFKVAPAVRSVTARFGRKSSAAL